MNGDVKRRIIAATADVDARAALETIDAAYFIVASQTVDDPADRVAVLARVVVLLGEHVDCLERRTDAVEAKLAAARPRHLHIVVPAPAESAPSVPTKRSNRDLRK